MHNNVWDFAHVYQTEEMCAAGVWRAVVAEWFQDSIRSSDFSRDFGALSHKGRLLRNDTYALYVYMWF
jgi:hypothetical protein